MRLFFWLLFFVFVFVCFRPIFSKMFSNIFLRVVVFYLLRFYHVLCYTYVYTCMVLRFLIGLFFSGAYIFCVVCFVCVCAFFSVHVLLVGVCCARVCSSFIWKPGGRETAEVVPFMLSHLLCPCFFPE